MEKSWNCVFEFLWEPCTENSLITETLPVASLAIILKSIQRTNNKEADQTAQMHRLVCAFLFAC